MSFSGYRLFSKPEVTHFSHETAINSILVWESIYFRIGRGTSKNVNSSKTGKFQLSRIPSCLVPLDSSRRVVYKSISVNGIYSIRFRVIALSLNRK